MGTCLTCGKQTETVTADHFGDRMAICSLECGAEWARRKALSEPMLLPDHFRRLGASARELLASLGRAGGDEAAKYMLVMSHLVACFQYGRRQGQREDGRPS